MSSYLLLRNNKESGPFTFDEIKGMSLKSYDLLWIVGKSASWRYPGEIDEIKSFAPPVPDQMADLFRPVNKENSNTISKESNVQKTNPAKTVYVNFPAEKKQAAIVRERIVADQELSQKQEPPFDFSDIYKKSQSKPVVLSGKILWISTIVLLFGAGLLTGFFISDRRKYFSKDEIHSQTVNPQQPVLISNTKEIQTPVKTQGIDNKTNGTNPSMPDFSKIASTGFGKTAGNSRKKNSIGIVSKKDSVVAQDVLISTLNLNDSLKKNAANKSELLYQKIKAHPENFLNLVTGRYSTGVFGGISSFTVTVTNNASILLDQVIVSIDYIQNNEKTFKTESLYFNGLEPGETVTLKAPKSSRGVKITTRMQVLIAASSETSNPN